MSHRTVLEKVKISDINVDEHLLNAVSKNREELDNGHKDIYESIKKNGFKPLWNDWPYHCDNGFFKPQAFVLNKQGDKYEIPNGQHRIVSAILNGLEEIDAYIYYDDYPVKHTKDFYINYMNDYEAFLQSCGKGMFQKLEFPYDLRMEDRRDESDQIFYSTEWDTPYWIGKKVLDIACFLEDANVLMSNFTYQSIKDLNIGDFVITPLGNNRKITKIYKHDYSGKLYKIKLLYDYELEATNEHPILVLSNNKVGYKKIEELKLGDKVAVSANNINPTIENVNLDFVHLCGWYLAEGSFIHSHKPKICGINFTLNCNEIEHIESIVQAAKNLGYNYSLTERKKLNRMDIRVYSKELAEHVFSIFGRYSHDKYISTDVFNWPNDAKIILLKALFAGDGHFRKGTKGGFEYALTTVSDELAKGVKLLLNQLDVQCTIYKYFTNKHRHNCISIYGTDINILKPDTVSYTSKKRNITIDTNTFIPIKNIETNDYTGIVYNLEIETDNSYIVNGMAVHNCNGGYFPVKAKEHGASLSVGFELDKWMYDKSNEYKDVVEHSDVIFENANFWDFNWQKYGLFDIVFCNQCIYHFGNGNRANDALERTASMTDNELVMFTFIEPEREYFSDNRDGYRPTKEVIVNDLHNLGFKRVRIYHRIAGAKYTVVASKKPDMYPIQWDSPHLVYSDWLSRVIDVDMEKFTVQRYQYDNPDNIIDEVTVCR